MNEISLSERHKGEAPGDEDIACGVVLLLNSKIRRLPDC
jgi:hypothetical protein